MKTTTRIIFAGALLAALSAPLVAAAAVNVDVVIGVPGYSTVVPQPVYYYPAPVYYTPAPRAFMHHHHRDRDWDRHYSHDERRHW